MFENWDHQILVELHGPDGPIANAELDELLVMARNWSSDPGLLWKNATAAMNLLSLLSLILSRSPNEVWARQLIATLSTHRSEDVSQYAASILRSLESDSIENELRKEIQRMLQYCKTGRLPPQVSQLEKFGTNGGQG